MTDTMRFSPLAAKAPVRRTLRASAISPPGMPMTELVRASGLNSF